MKDKNDTAKKQTSLKKNIFSASFIAGAIAITVLLNVVAVMATHTFGLSKDFTVQKVYSLSNEAKSVAKSVEQATTIYVLEDEDEFSSASAYFYQANQIINHFAKANKNIKIEYIDLNKNPGFLNDYTDSTLYSGDIIVKVGDKYKTIPSSNLFHSQETEEGNYYINSSRAESAIASAILSLTKEDLKKVAVLTDKNPYPTGTISYLLEDNQYIVDEISISKKEIPKEYDVVILFSPREDYSKEDIKKIENFLKRENKTIVYVGDTAQPEKLPNTAKFLLNYGIHAGSGVVCETNSGNIYNQNPYSIFAQYENKNFGGKIPNGNLKPLAGFAKPLTITTPQHSGVSVTPLLKYSSGTVIRPTDADSSWSAGSEKKQSNLKAAVLAQRKLSSGKTCNLLALSTASFFDSDALTNTGVSNAQYFITVLNELTGREDTVAITDKTLGSGSLSMSDSEVSTLTIFFTMFVPIAVLLVGGLVWFRRRKQ